SHPKRDEGDEDRDTILKVIGGRRTHRWASARKTDSQQGGPATHPGQHPRRFALKREAQIDLRLDPVAHFLAVHSGPYVGGRAVCGAIRCDRDHSPIEERRRARVTKADRDGIAIERYPVLIDDGIHGRRAPAANTVVKGRITGAPRRRRNGPVANYGHPPTGDAFIIETAVGQLGGPDAEHRLVEKAKADVGNPGLVLSVDVVEGATLRRARSGERRVSGARPQGAV